MHHTARRVTGVVGFTLAGIGDREIRDGLVEAIPAAEIPTDTRGIPGASKGPRECPGAEIRVLGEIRPGHQVEVGLCFHVPELPQVVRPAVPPCAQPRKMSLADCIRYKLDQVMEGKIDELIDGLAREEKADQVAALAQ